MDDRDIETAAGCIAAGARCLITRTAGSAAVRSALALAWPVAQAGQQRPVTGRGGFTAREISILTSMADGLSNVDIGARLFVSADTVKTQAKRLFSKLGVHDRAAAVAAGLRRGLIA
ncbi:MAG: DNA-binding response regulator [Actinobacteria bacterium]|nr:DNA-binding response regulator [Actinomycetota bacterium]